MGAFKIPPASSSQQLGWPMKKQAMQRMYIRHAIFGLLLAWAAVNVLPPKLLLRWATRSPKQIRRFSDHEIEWIAWAIEEVSGSRWARYLRLPSGLAAQILLRWRGISTELCVLDDQPLRRSIATSWVECPSGALIGAVDWVRLASRGP